MKMPLPAMSLLAWLAIAAALICVWALLVAWVSPKAPDLIEVPSAQALALPGGQIRYDEQGDGDHAIVFLHGFNGQLGDWNLVWEQMDGCGRRLRLDVPGFGGSIWTSADFSLPTQAQRIIELLDAKGIRRVTLVGTSMGGSLAAWLAAKHPRRVSGVVLLAPSGYPDSLHYSGLFGRLVKPGTLNRAGHWIASRRPFATAFPRSRALQATSVTASYGPPWAQAITEIKAPTLLIWSRGDSSFHAAEAVQQSIVNSRLIPVAHEAGHLLAQTRPALAAAAACMLARGMGVDESVSALRTVLRDGPDAF